VGRPRRRPRPRRRRRRRPRRPRPLRRPRPARPGGGGGPPGATPPAKPAEAPTAAKPAEAPAAAAKPGAALKPVPRERTLIVLRGGANGQNPQFANFNNFVTGANHGWHTGPVQVMAEPLIMFNVLTGDYENWLAESWKYNSTFTELTLTLRKGIEWSDGKPLTAKDVAFTFNLIRDNQAKLTHTAEISFLQEAIAEDNAVVRFVLKQPNPRWWATTLTSNHGISEQLLPEHIWAGQDPQTFAFYDPAKGWPISTGPYKLVETTPQQKVFDRRDDWWAVKTGFKPLPKVERVIFIPDRDDSLASQMLISNQTDVSKLMPVPTLRSIFAQNPKVTTFSGQEPPFGYLDWCPMSIGFNNSAPPYDDKDVRWAINYAIDREKLVGLAEGGAGSLALHQFTPYTWFKKFDDALKPTLDKYGLDTKGHLDRTEKLMTGKGYAKDGQGFWASGGKRLDLKIYVPEGYKAYGPPLTQQLRDAGFEANFDTSPGLESKVQTGEQAVYFGCQGPSGVKGMDPYFMCSIFTSQYFRPTGQPAPISWATARWRNADFDAAVKQMDPLGVDDPKTLELFTKAMDIWISELPMIYVAQLVIRFPMNTQYWTGWPSKDDVYGFPHPWQQEFMKTIVKLQPTR
jgi:peptide/nickel transport system substrate-binding protein